MGRTINGLFLSRSLSSKRPFVTRGRVRRVPSRKRSSFGLTMNSIAVDVLLAAIAIARRYLLLTFKGQKTLSEEVITVVAGRRSICNKSESLQEVVAVLFLRCVGPRYKQRFEFFSKMCR